MKFNLIRDNISNNLLVIYINLNNSIYFKLFDK